MAGPLRPQWVTSSGPSVRSLVPGSEASTCSTETPEMSASRGSLMLNVKSEGTGGMMVWPKDSAIASPPEALLPPVAMIRPWQSRGSPAPSVSFRPSAVRSTERTAVWTRMSTPARRAAPSRQSAIVAESSVMGNMRPSASVFVATPRAANQATVSRGWKRWKAPSSSRPPRG